MASAEGIRAGKAYISVGLNDSALQRGMKQVQKRLKTFGSAITSIGTRFATLGGAAAAPFGLAIKAAGDMAETASKFDAIFKGNAEAVRAWAATYAKAVGRSRKDTEDFLASSQALLTPFGFDSRQAAEMSKRITQLATDLGSFFNVADADAFAAIMSGLVGEAEPMKKFGVLVMDTQVGQELLRSGMAKTTKEATDQMKVMARLNIIMRGTAAAQGDAIKTAGSFNNQTKALKATLDDLAVAVGEALLPAATKVFSTLRRTIAPLAEFVKLNRGAVILAAGAAAAVGGLGVALLGLGAAVQLVAFGVGGLAIALGALTSPITLVAGALAGAGVALLRFTDMGGQALAWLGDRFGELRATATTAFQGMADALTAGDMALAGKVLWSALNVEWTRGIAGLNALWADWGVATVEVFRGVSFDIARLWVNLTTELELGWVRLMDAIRAVWDRVMGGLGETLRTAFGAAAQVAFGAAAPGAAIAQGAGLGAGGAAAIEERRKAALAALDDQEAAEITARRKAAQSGLEAAQEALRLAQEELAAARGQAAEKAAAVKPGKLPKEFTEGLGAAMGQADRKITAKGTFSAAALRGMGIGDQTAGMEEKQDQTNRTLEGMRNDIRRNRPVWA